MSLRDNGEDLGLNLPGCAKISGNLSISAVAAQGFGMLFPLV